VNSFELNIWDNEGAKCTFYTVQWDGAEYSETDKFFLKFENSEFSEELQMLLRYLTQSIGNKYGADKKFFNRNENQVFGLPHHGKFRIEDLSLHFPQFPLRLYALRLSNQIVILFNGAEKDAATNQTTTTNLNFIVNEANSFAKRIEKALLDGDIYLKERNIYTFNHSIEIVL
jgi:hypothetical protein